MKIRLNRSRCDSNLVDRERDKGQDFSDYFESTRSASNAIIRRRTRRHLNEISRRSLSFSRWHSRTIDSPVNSNLSRVTAETLIRSNPSRSCAIPITANTYFSRRFAHRSHDSGNVSPNRIPRVYSLSTSFPRSGEGDREWNDNWRSWELSHDAHWRSQSSVTPDANLKCHRSCTSALKVVAGYVYTPVSRESSSGFHLNKSFD